MVDRVLDLHEKLVTGEVQDARVRLIYHLRQHGGERPVASVSGFDLVYNSALKSYKNYPNDVPPADLNLLLRYFERANALRLARAVNEPLFADLVAGHAIWWDRAVTADRTWPTRQHLGDLAQWARAYLEKHPDDEKLQRWRLNVVRDFESPRIPDSGPPPETTATGNSSPTSGN